jgi:hypothetical protein
MRIDPPDAKRWRGASGNLPAVLLAAAVSFVPPAFGQSSGQDTSSGSAAGGQQAADQSASSEQSQAAGANALEEITVFGRNVQLLGTADSASQGFIAGADLKLRPLLRVAGLLETVPGLIAAQHSGSGKANQYYLRGVNLDHGTDLLGRVDGMPWNLPSHGHAQGYFDLNGLIPETVDRIAYRKGPYRADTGDFSMIGTSMITTVDRYDRPWLSLEDGQYGWRRIVGGASTNVGDGVLTGAGQLKTYDGPWQHPDNLQHESLWAKYTKSEKFGKLAVSLSRYHATWDPTEQEPERVFGSAVCPNEFCSLDPTAVGETLRWIATANLTGDKWNATAYAQSYDWHMLSNPTYDYQINQFDHRWTAGGHTTRTLINTMKLELDVGGDFRYDDISSVGLDHTNAGVLLENIIDNGIREGAFGVYSEITYYPTEKLRLFGGLRGDAYHFDVTALTPGSVAGTKSSSLMSPKVGLAYTVNNKVEIYGNWGRGFHSNDARGVLNPTIPVAGLAQGTGYEAGARFELASLKMTAAYWWLNESSELLFAGDTNTVEPKGASKRHGYELTFFWKPLDWLGLDAVYTGTHSRFVDNPAGPYIPQSPSHVGEIGLDGATGPWQIGARLRYLGSYPLIEDNSKRADPERMLNLRGARVIGNITVYATLLNVFNRHGKDIVYYYPAYVAGFDPPGLTSNDIDCSVVNCRMSRAEEPRTLRLGVKLAF